MDYVGGRVRYEEFGLETVMRSHNTSLKSRSDVIMVWLHYCFLRNLFKTLGGEGAISEHRTEHLPRHLGWNGERKVYVLKYEYDNRIFVLSVYIRDKEADASIVTLEKSLRIAIPVADIVRDDLTMRDDVVDNFTEIIEREFIDPIKSKKATSADNAHAYDPFQEDPSICE